MSPAHPGVASATSASAHGPIIFMPNLRSLLGRLPHCARGRVLEQDALGEEAIADGVRRGEVLPPARLVPLRDGGRDLRLVELPARASLGAQLGEEARRLLPEDAEDGR